MEATQGREAVGHVRHGVNGPNLNTRPAILLGAVVCYPLHHATSDARGMKSYLGAFLALVLVALVSFAVGRHSASIPREDPGPGFVDATPNWVPLPDCSPLNDDDRARYELALQGLRTFGRLDSPRIAALRYFARPQYRMTGDWERLCFPMDLLPELAEVTLQEDFFIRGRPLRGDRLGLARRLGPRDPRIVESVAETAFSPHPVANDVLIPGQDVRTLARVILAEFGSPARQWSEQAFDAMNADNRLGTTAAQVAVALGHPRALDRASELLRDLLEQYPEDPIPLSAVNQFYDLVFAIAWAGPEAEPHAVLLIGLLDRRIESTSTSFGILQLTPSGVCWALQRIGGVQIDEVLASEPCRQILE